MLEISGKVQWSTLFLHHKTAIFVFTYKAYNDGLSSTRKAYNDGLSSILTISLVIVDANGDKPQTINNFARISMFIPLVGLDKLQLKLPYKLKNRENLL